MLGNLSRNTSKHTSNPIVVMPIVAILIIAIIINATFLICRFSYARDSDIDGIEEIEIGVEKNGYLNATDAKKYYKAKVVSEAKLVVTLEGAKDADFDVYIKKGSLPSTSSYEWRSTKKGSSEYCVIERKWWEFWNNLEGIYYIMVYSYEGYGNYTLALNFASNEDVESGLGKSKNSTDTLVNIQDLISKVSISNLKNYVSKLESFGTRYSFTENCTKAGEYVYQTFESFGLKVEYDEFTFYSNSYYFSKYNGYKLKNIIATQAGQQSTLGNKTYIISAHYDSINWRDSPNSIKEPYAPAPGADDAGSGMAVVLETARILSTCEFNFTIKYIAFSAEEQWLVGSEHYVKNAKRSSENIDGVINVELCGYGNKHHVSGDRQSAWLVNFIKGVQQKYELNFAVKYHIGEEWKFRGSDHASFNRYGYSAICGIEAPLDPDIWDNDYNPNYHRNTDTSETLNFALLEMVTKLYLATIAELAELSGDNTF